MTQLPLNLLLLFSIFFSFLFFFFFFEWTFIHSLSALRTISRDLKLLLLTLFISENGVLLGRGFIKYLTLPSISPTCLTFYQFSSVHSLSRARLFASP